MRWFFVSVLVLTGAGNAAHAQVRVACEAPERPAAGIVVGRSSPYFDLTPGVAGQSVAVRGGSHWAARVDVPIASPWRARVEAGASNWRVEGRTYSPVSGALVATEKLGHVDARQFIALFGRQAGWQPACAYVLAGGGLYALDYRGAGVRRPGAALTAGIEVPTGRRGAVQVDVQLHTIGTDGRHPIASSTALAASLSAGWSLFW
jgi:hypothetical protein